MPELPEVETVARDLASQVTGARILGVDKLDWPKMVETPEVEAFKGLLRDRVIEKVYRRAKWLLLALDHGWTLAIHLRMSGSIGVYPADVLPDTYTHLVLALADGRRLFFRDIRKFGKVRLLDPRGLAGLDAAHGPEPLSEAFTRPILSRLLEKRSTKIKPLLLDQAVIAGLGNIYVDESLWRAQIHPERPAASLKPKEIAALHEAIRFVLAAAVTRRGSTLRDYRTGFGEVGENQFYFQAYNRTGEPCPRCGTPITRRVVGQRGTHYCPNCQRA